MVLPNVSTLCYLKLLSWLALCYLREIKVVNVTELVLFSPFFFMKFESIYSQQPSLLECDRLDQI